MALVLKRRPKESINIYNDYNGEIEIVIDVLSINGNQCTIAIDAPKSKTILRNEIKYQKKIVKKLD